MVVHELTVAECYAVLSRVHLGRLACSRGDQPYVVPIQFSFDAEKQCVYSFSTVGQKIRWMRDNPKVCLELDDIGDKDHWTTLVVMGRYEEIQHTRAYERARQRAERFFQKRPEWWFPAAARLAGSEEHPDIVIYRIAIDQLTGRRADRNTSIPAS
jgi:nitroimidazol reductase NimA-like FMN-containing flavoprotein (pyridoxamine 5'-phosphate oxidase superfamily)